MNKIVEALFVPKLIDNSPRGWVRLGGQTFVQSAFTSAGMFGGLFIVGWILTKIEEDKVRIKAEAIEEYKKTQINQVPLPE
jgi:hypothetical protein